MLTQTILIGALLLSGCLIARPEKFSFSAAGSAGGYSGSGTITTLSNGDGSYVITGLEGPGVTGLLAPGVFRGNCNLLYPASTYLLDETGFSFNEVLAGTVYEANIRFVGGARSYALTLREPSGEESEAPVSFVLASAASVSPEPSSIALLSTGLFGIGAAVRSRPARGCTLTTSPVQENACGTK